MDDTHYMLGYVSGGIGYIKVIKVSGTTISVITTFSLGTSGASNNTTFKSYAMALLKMSDTRYMVAHNDNTDGYLRLLSVDANYNIAQLDENMFSLNYGYQLGLLTMGATKLLLSSFSASGSSTVYCWSVYTDSDIITKPHNYPINLGTGVDNATAYFKLSGRNMYIYTLYSTDRAVVQPMLMDGTGQISRDTSNNLDPGEFGGYFGTYGITDTKFISVATKDSKSTAMLIDFDLSANVTFIDELQLEDEQTFYHNIDQISANNYGVVYSNSQGYLKIINTDSDTLNITAEIALAADTSYNAIAAIDANNILVAYNDITNSDGVIKLIRINN